MQNNYRSIVIDVSAGGIGAIKGVKVDHILSLDKIGSLLKFIPRGLPRDFTPGVS